MHKLRHILESKKEAAILSRSASRGNDSVAHTTDGSSSPVYPRAWGLRGLNNATDVWRLKRQIWIPHEHRTRRRYRHIPGAFFFKSSTSSHEHTSTDETLLTILPFLDNKNKCSIDSLSQASPYVRMHFNQLRLKTQRIDPITLTVTAVCSCKG